VISIRPSPRPPVPARILSGELTHTFCLRSKSETLLGTFRAIRAGRFLSLRTFYPHTRCLRWQKQGCLRDSAGKLAPTMARAIGGGRSIVIKQVSGNR